MNYKKEKIKKTIQLKFNNSSSSTSTCSTSSNSSSCQLTPSKVSNSSQSSESLRSIKNQNQFWPEPSPQPSQQLIITLIGAKDLKFEIDSKFNHPHFRPYAVLQFDHTESITNEAGSLSPSSASPPKIGPRWRFNRANNKSSISISNHSLSRPPSPSTVCHLTQTDPSNSHNPIWNHVAIFDIFKPKPSLFISIYHHNYLYHPNPDLPSQEKVEQFLGGAIVDLRTLLKPKSFDMSNNPNPAFNLLPNSSNLHSTPPSNLHFPSLTPDINIVNSPFNTVILDDSIDLWNESGEIKTGSILIKIEIRPTDHAKNDTKAQNLPVHHDNNPWFKKKISMDDFEIIKMIGEGSYGQVYRVRKKDTRRLYAMKTLEKSKILIPTEGSIITDDVDDGKIKLERVLTERKILEKTRGCEFLVGLKFSFQTKENLNLVMDLKSGGELMSYMQRFGGRFDEPWVVFYTAEILSGLKYLHSMNIAYRDLKPENCLLDATGHVALCDFGLSKLDMKLDSITKTFCGTTEYIAPEVLVQST